MLLAVLCMLLHAEVAGAGACQWEIIPLVCQVGAMYR